MAELRGESPSDNRRKGGNVGKRVGEVASGSPAPCGACKFLRRKCISGCIFAPHFGTDQGAARFAAVHKVFGASNVSKLLLNIPMNRRHDAVVTISYEAQARLSDPVYGCVSTILALQQQVHSSLSSLFSNSSFTCLSYMYIALTIYILDHLQMLTSYDLQNNDPYHPPLISTICDK